MENLVFYPPQKPGDYSYVSYDIWGILPVRLVVNRRVDGWCVYMLPKYLTADYVRAYNLHEGQPTPFELVRDHGHKLPEDVAKTLFAEMGDLPYAH